MFNSFLQKYANKKNIIFLLILVLFLIFLFKINDIALLFFATYVIACSLNPLVDRLSKKMNRNLASVLVLGGAVGVVILFFVPVITLLSFEIKAFASELIKYINNFDDIIKTIPFIDKTTLANIDLGGVVSSATTFTSNVVNDIINIGMHLGSTFLYILVSIIIIFYFLADKKIIKETYLKLFPSQMRKRANEIIEIISKKIGGYIIAQIAAITSVGIVMTIGLLILRVDYAILLGLLTAILDIIPVVGPAMALVICLIATYQYGPLMLLFVALVFSAAQLIENNLVRPYAFSRLMNIHPILIFLFLFIAAKYMGIIGVVFAPAIAATVCVLIEELYIRNLD